MNSIAGSFTSRIQQSQDSLESYLKELQQQGNAEATLRNYRSDISQFLEFCKVHQLDPAAGSDAVEKFEDFQRKKHLKDASIRRKSVSVNSFLSWLTKTQTIDQDHSSQVSKKTENKTNQTQEASYIIPIAIEKILNQYLTTLKYNTISDTTIRNYRSDIKQLAVFTKAQTIVGLLALDQLKRFAADQKQKGLKPTSIQRKLVSITQFALWAQRRKLVSGVTTEWSAQVMDTIFDKSDGPIVVTPPTEDKSLAIDVRKRRRRESLLAGLVLLLLLFGSTIGLFLVKSVQDIRQRAYVDPKQNQQITQTTTTTTTTTGSTDKRTLPFRGKLYSSETGQQITGTTGASFKLYNNAAGSGEAIWESGVCEVSTNDQGIFDILLGGKEEAENGCGPYLSDDIYFGNSNLWLSTIINSEQLALYPIKTVEYAKDSALLAGYPIGDPVIKESILFMNEYGEVLFADEPTFNVPEGDLTLSGNNLYFVTEGLGGAFFDSLIVAPYGYFGGADNPALVLQSTENATKPLMVWADSTGTTMGVIDANGNIGLGTETPQGLLGLGNNGAYLSAYGDDLLFYDEANGTLLSLSQLAKDEVGVNYWDKTNSDISYSTGNVSVGTSVSEQALTVSGNLQLGVADADRYIYFDNGTGDNAGIRYNSTDNTIQFSHDGSTWSKIGAGQVTSITSTDSSITLNPTTGIGDVDLALNLGTAHNWTGQQNFASNVGIGTTAPSYKLDVQGTAGDIVARFNGRVIGADAVNSDEFVTLGQVTGLTLPTGSGGETLYYDGSAWVATTNLYNDGTNIGIGTNVTDAALTLAADTLASGGISFGGDTNIYRSAANTLKTDDAFVLGSVGTGTTNSVITRETDGTLTARTIDSRVWGSSLMSGSGTTGYVTYWDTDNSIAAEQYLSVTRGGLGSNVTALGAGEILYSTGTSAYDSLAAGSANQLLISGGAAAPSWSNVASLLTAGDDIDITGTTNATITLEDDIDLTALRASSASGLSLYDDGGVLGLFLQDATGNVGIGTTSPEQQLTTTGNLQLGTSNATRYIYFDNGTASNSGFRYNSATGRLEFSDNGSVWNNFGTGDGTVTSVTNADGTITVFPTDGDVVASINLANANNWTAQQTFGANVGIGVTSTTAALDFAAGTTAAAGIEFGGDTTLYRAAADTLKTDDNFILGTAGVGTTNSVITRETDGTLTARDIDARVWGSTLLDGSGTTGYVTYWSDSDTLAAEQYLSTLRGGLGGDVTALGAGELLYSTGTSTYDSLAAGSANQLLISGGTASPSWSDISSLLTAGDDIDITGSTNATITLEDDIDLTVLRASSVAGLALYDDGGNLGLFVADQGNVGVGTNTPDTTFHVDVGATNRNIKFSANSGFSTGLDIFSGTQYSQLIQETTGELSIKNRNLNENIQFIVNDGGILTTALTVEGASGNVGIGTSSPGAKLGFVADTTAAGGIDFGGDTNIYRSAANTLVTDDDFNVLGGNLGIGASGEIYLSAVDTLRTDDTFVLGSIALGTTDSVITRELDGSLTARTADSRIWGSSLIDGSGTTNYLSKFTDDDTLANSVVYDDGTNVGIGTTSPEQQLTVNGNLQLGVADADKYIYFDNGTATNAGIRYNSTTNILEFSNDGTSWNQFGSGSGSVTSVTNADGTLTISPTTGDVVASLNLANANTWTGAQTFNANTYFPGSTIIDTAGNVGIG
ncbi:MAG: site-specific integrase, partial [Patescibacteria group bacterium]